MTTDPAWNEWTFEYEMHTDLGSFYGDTQTQCLNAYNEALRIAVKHQRLNPEESELSDIRDLRQSTMQA